MRLVLSLACLVAGSQLFAAEKEKPATPAEVLKTLLADYRKASEVLQTVNDNETADSALPKIKELSGRIDKAKKQWADFKLCRDLKGELFEKNEKAYNEACEAMQDAIAGLNNAFTNVSGDRQKKVIEAIGKMSELELFK